MGFVLIFAIVIILIIVTFLLVFFLPKPTVFFDPYDVCKELIVFMNEYKNIEDEVKNFTFTQTESYCEHIIWDFEKRNEINVVGLEKTYELANSIPNLIKISIIDIGTKSGRVFYPEKGLNCIFTINEPHSKKCFVASDGEKKYVEAGKWIILNSEKDYQIQNGNKSERLRALYIVVDKVKH